MLHHCARCGRELEPGRLVWLELSTKTGRYTDPDRVRIPEDESQGLFPFGKDCAKEETR